MKTIEIVESTPPPTPSPSTPMFKVDDPVIVVPRIEGKEVKKGVIAAVVEAGTQPNLNDFPDLLLGGKEPGKPRTSISYVVKVLPDSPRQKAYHIWPFTKFIQPSDKETVSMTKIIDKRRGVLKALAEGDTKAPESPMDRPDDRTSAQMVHEPPKSF